MGAEQGDPRLQSFRLQGEKSPAVLFFGVPPQGYQLGLFVTALSCHCLNGSRGLRLCCGNLGMSWCGGTFCVCEWVWSLLWLWVAVWSPVGPAGSLESPREVPQSQQGQSGLVGCGWQCSWMSRQNYCLGLGPNHRSCVRASFLFLSDRTVSIHSMELGLKEKVIQICRWRISICIHLFLISGKAKWQIYINFERLHVLWHRESQRRLFEHYNFMPNCGAVKTKHNVFTSKI